jgi:hypothetical protein
LEPRRNLIYEKYSLKKFIVLFSLGFILFGFNFVRADEDKIAPVITLNTPTSVDIKVGELFTDPGATAIDDTDSSVSVVSTGIVDSTISGTYTITYTAVDAAGNVATPVMRTVIVKDVSTPPTPPTLISIDTTVNVPATCEVLDTDNISHTYTASSSDSYVGICALKAALDLGSISNVKLSNKYPSMGLFVTTFNNTEADSNSQYWALYQNGGYTDFGISTLPISVSDVISFKLSDFSGKETGDSVVIRVGSLILNNTTDSNQNSSSGSLSIPSIEKTFSISNALNFLIQNQNSDGSYGSTMYTDWVAIAAKAGNNITLKSSILNYLKSNPISSSTITDYERRAMALMALGINPYNGTDVNYINKIIASYNGTQIGDSSLTNDDIFGLIVLSHAGYIKNDEIIKKVVPYVILKQSSDGSWGSIDMTAAAIQSLNNFKSLGGVKKSIENAELYLKNNQSNDGGFGNSFSTSWAAQALSQNNSFSFETSNAINYLKDKQLLDGGLYNGDTKSRVWATSYAIPAVLKLSWNDVLESFDKPEENNISQDEAIEELPIITETEIPSPVVEAKEIEAPLKPIYSVKIKKENIIKNEAILPIEEKTNDNLLGANAIGIVQKPNIFLPLISRILHIIITPFIWLWVHLNI